MNNKTHQQYLLDTFSALPEGYKPQAAPKVWDMIFSTLSAPCRVLVAGAGRGGLSWILDKAGYEVTSCDLHPDHFKPETLSCEFADFMKPLPYDDEQFDIIIATEVMEHLDNPWFFMRESIRCLKDGGKYIFTSPNVMSLHSRLLYLGEGLFPYFRESSFFGCHHVTPIFEWAVERCCTTCHAHISKIKYSRVGWPQNNDVPRHNTRYRKHLLKFLPVTRLFGEITGYEVTKDASSQTTMKQGYHPD